MAPSRRWIIGIFVALLVGWLGSSTLVVLHLTRRAQPIRAELAPAYPGLETHRLTTKDGQKIGAWLLRQYNAGVSILLLHGNGGSRTSSWSLGQSLFEVGHTVLLITFRAHGDSTGIVNDIGYGGRFDVLAAVEFLEHRWPGRPIVIYGFSLGAAAAAFASGELGTRVAGYLLDAPYPDLTTSLQHRLKIYLPPPLDRIAWWGMMAVSPFILPHIDQIAPAQAVAGIPEGIPVVVMTGEADQRAPPKDVLRVFQKVHTHAKLIRFPDTAHGQAPRMHPKRFLEAILELITHVKQR